MPAWTRNDMPSQAGQRAIITGATGGLGFEAALALAQAGSAVVLAARDPAKGADALGRLRAACPGADVHFARLDLASLASVRAFAQTEIDRGRPLDLLINNAGVMALPTRRVTEDGFEMQMGTNYLGHVALTAALLPALRAAPAPRVVSLSSLAHRGAHIKERDLQAAKRYTPWGAYGQSKLAMLMFALTLERQSAAHGWGIASNAAHPGLATTDLFTSGPGRRGIGNRLMQRALPFFGHNAASGVLPVLYAATAPEAAGGGGYYGPAGWFEIKGPPAKARVASAAADTAAGARLWRQATALTGAIWPD